MSEYLESIARLTRDLRNASITLSAREVRFLVDAYYAMQRDRIRATHQERKLAESAEPNAIMGWLADQRSTLEKQIARALDAYSAEEPAGKWARSIVGVGPIIAAGLIAHLDIKQAPTAGHFWRIAGLDPSSKWIGKEGAKKVVDAAMAEAAQVWSSKSEASSKFYLALNLIAIRINLKVGSLTERLKDKDGKVRETETALISAVAKLPWNGSLKRLCWLIGESFTKVSNNENDIYGKIYAERKVLEIARNEAGQFADQAAASLKEKNWKADTETRKHYEAGRLPPARIHLRAQRVAVKLFLSHLHHVMYELEFKQPPPAPFIMTRPEHAHYLAPPNWPMAALAERSKSAVGTERAEAFESAED